ncbi:cilia- and flagella-associated protein HOATZ-like [Dreissena polymorpha]|uniref:Cilia- and flagella-associated protein HOATZ n=1 Tax=Dreissena polymorpha TaxID=45954 RepID=A0A9D4RVH0_DREPO|nr:cilia- and flagella-associated protein HOATZ-like [Dreissena polymorpha]KAH3880350.1 hypothetical protein DPMN_004264 [Dreissena polymorpha]
MAVVVDLTKQNETTTFYGSSEEDVSYANNFWQSIQLHPPMESRLVSSDIKQRLKVAPPSSQARHVSQSRQEEQPGFREFISKARTMEHLEEYARLQQFAEAKAEDKKLLEKHRETRKKKEEVSRNKGIKQVEKLEDKLPREDYEVEEENEVDALKQLDDFENERFENLDDSDSN